jgi:hypothetical protein
MDCRIRLAATLLNKGFISHDITINDSDYCHGCLGEETDSKCYQGKVFDQSNSWLICDQCLDKVTSVPEEKMFLDELLLKQKLEEDFILERQLLTRYVC